MLDHLKKLEVKDGENVGSDTVKILKNKSDKVGKMLP